MSWWRRLFQKNRLERQLDSELRYHFERLVADHRQAGLSETEARRRARLEFGGMDQVSESCRDARGTRWVETSLQDVRFAFRLLRRSPGFTAVAVLSLALGIGANTAIFSMIDALLLRPLPVANPEQLLLFGTGRSSGVFDDFPNGSTDLFSRPFFEAVRANRRGFADIIAVESLMGEVHARIADRAPESVTIRLVSGNFFSVLGVGAAAGRLLTDADDKPAAPPVAIMSYKLWRKRFALDPAVVGSTMRWKGAVFTVAGVAAPDFYGVSLGEASDFWAPIAMQPQVEPWFQDPTGNFSESLWLVGRPRAGVTTAQTKAEANLAFQQWLQHAAGPSPSAEKVADMRHAFIEITSAAKGISSLRLRFSEPLQILMAVVGLVLLIACANLANLQLARAAARSREFSVRLALGAGRSRLGRQLVTESLLLALAGGAIGAWVGFLASRALIPPPVEVRFEWSTLLFGCALSLLTAAFFGLLPALRMTRVDMAPALKEGRGTPAQAHGRFGAALVIVQVALAVVLVVGAGLFIGTFRRLESAGTGFDKDGVVLVHLDPDSSGVEGADRKNLLRRIRDRVRQLPGVEAASYTMMTFGPGSWTAPVWPQGVAHTEANAREIRGNRVGEQYFEVLGIPVVEGRTFSPQDTPASPHVAVINQTMAQKLFPQGSPLGRHFSMGGRDDYDFEVIGVVKDAKYNSVRETPRPVWYVAAEQEKEDADCLAIRTGSNTKALLSQLRGVIRAENPDLAVSEITTLREVVDGSLNRERLLAMLTAIFSGLALLLAAMGIYGVIAYSVARRTGEIGIRMALGARPALVLSMVLRESLRLVAIGLGIGIAIALVCGRLIAAQLYGTTPSDPLTVTASVGVLLAVALAATILPARRAARLDPLAALRES
jgi:predicted permease